jgi:hypothetical protein
VKAEAGIGNANPTVVSAGTIQYWNGAGYSSIAVGSGASSSIPLTTVSATSGSTTATLQIGASLRTGAATSGACPSPCASATAQAESPIVGDIHYTVVVSGVTVTDLNIHIDFGTLIAHAEYTPGA